MMFVSKTTITSLVAIAAIASSHVAFSAETRGLGRNTNSEHSTAFSTGVYRAVIIGNNQYRDPENVWKPLSTAVDDARAIADILKKRYSFTDIELLIDAKRRDILQAFSRLGERTGENDSVLVYYAGHGWRNEKTREAFWIPVDAEGKDDSTYVSNSRIKEKLSVIAEVASHTLLISDSCFSGTLLSAGRGAVVDYEQDKEAYFRKIARRKSVQILAAGGSEYVDDDYRRSGHSPFTYFLLKELLENDNKYMTFSSLALDVEQLVARNVDQTPQSGALRKAGDEGGQFIFKRSGGVDNIRNDTVESRRYITPLPPKTRPIDPPSSDDGDTRSLVLPMPSF